MSRLYNKYLQNNKYLQKIPYLFNFFPIKNGYIHEEIKDDDYVLGASPLIKKVLREDSDWSSYLPATETQHTNNFYFDTMSCVSFSFLNCLEMIAKEKYNEDWNLSDRFLAKISGTTRNGNSMTRVADSARKIGLITEDQYSWNRETENYESFFETIDNTLLEIAKEFLMKYTIGYEAVLPNYNAMQEALKYSPLWVSGYAWYEKGGTYYSAGSPNHAFTIVKQDLLKKKKIAFDSYNSFVKELEWNYKFGSCKIITLEKTGNKFNIEEINKLINKGIKFIQRPLANGEIYELIKNELIYKTPEQARDLGIRTLSENGTLIGINEEFFNKLIL